MKIRKSMKQWIAILMMLAMVIGSFSGTSLVFAAEGTGVTAWEKEETAVEELDGKTYVLVLSSIGTKHRVSTGMGTAELSDAEVALANTPVFAGADALNYEDCNLLNNDNIASYQWKIEADGNGGYYVRSAGIADDANAYLNIESNKVTLGEKQSLTIAAASGSNAGTYQISDGTNLLRFTNSYNNSTYDAFTAANKTASSYFELYVYSAGEVVEPEIPEPEKTIMYTRINSLEELDGTFVMGMEGIGPKTGEGANQENLKVAAKTASPEGLPANLDYGIFNGEANEDSEGMLWEVAPYGSGYSIKAAQGAEDAYLRIDGSAITFGEAQALQITVSDGYFFISNGSNYIRFTNSYNNTSCFTAGTSTSSRNVIFYKVSESSEVEILPPEGEPIFTLAAISDLHTDAGIEGWEEPIRGSVTLTTKAIYEQEDADVILLGGDLTSAHMGSSWGSSDAEKIANFKAAQNAIIEAAESATDSHRVLYATGNHDFAIGLKTFNSGDYIDAQERYLPELVDAKSVDDVEANAYFQRTMPSGTAAGVEHVLAYHYNIDGLDFIVLNTPYIGADKHNDYNYDTDSLNWIKNKLDAIGKDKTVFFIAHYPLNTDKNLSSGKGVNAATQAVLKESVLDEYPNAIYLYGHDHGGYKIVADTYERVTTYDANGNSYDNRYVMPDGFVSSFVGSMSYYGTGIEPSSLGDETPNVIQGLMVYVYEDRIVFQMKNYGVADMGSYILKEYTLLRDMNLDDNSDTITKVRLDESADVKIGTTLKLEATVLPYSAAERGIIWSTSDASVAEVDQNGLVTTKSVGTAVIRAAAEGNPAIYAECTVSVNEATMEEVAELIHRIDNFVAYDYSQLDAAQRIADEVLVLTEAQAALVGEERIALALKNLEIVKQLDEAEVFIQDLSKNAIRIPYANTAAFEKIDGEVYMDGNIAVPHQDSLENALQGKNSFTVEAFIIPTGTPQYNMILGKGDYAFALRLRPGNVDFHVYDGADWRPIEYEQSSAESATWMNQVHQVVGVYNAETNRVEVYVDGEFKEDASAGTNGVASSVYNLMIGACPDTGRTSEMKFEQVRVYNKALTAAEILGQYAKEPAISYDDEAVELWVDFDQIVIDGLKEPEPEVLEIITQPENTAVYKGKDAVVSVEATGEGLTYKWYYKNPGNVKFYESNIEFENENVYSIPMYAWRDGQEVYCVVTDKYGDSVQSNTVKLTMSTGTLAITEQPKSAVVANGTEAVLKVGATGDNLSYTWYYKNPGNVKFYVSGEQFVSADGTTYTIPMAVWRDGQQVYCVITDGNGASIQTNTVTLSSAK